MYNVNFIYDIEDEFDGTHFNSTVSEDKEFDAWDEAIEYYDSLRNCPWISNITMVDITPDVEGEPEDEMALKDFGLTVEELMHIEEITEDDVQIVCNDVYLPVAKNLHRKVRFIVEPYYSDDKFVMHVYEE